MPENTDGSKQEEFEPITTQEELDKIIGKRIMRERDKYKNFDEYKNAAKELAQIKEANQSELEKATSRAEKAEKELESLKHAKELSDIAKEVSQETGVPADALRGSTREELQDHAKLLQKYMKEDAAPYIGSDGKKPEASEQHSAAEAFEALLDK